MEPETQQHQKAVDAGRDEAHGAGHDIHISHGDWLSATALRWLAGH